MMKPTIIFLFLLLFTAITIQAQDNQEDYRIVYLKDGSILKGYLQPLSITESGAKIKLLNGAEVFVANEFIQKIQKPQSQLVYFDNGLSYKPMGAYSALHINGLWGYDANVEDQEPEKRTGVGLHYVLGGKINEKAAFGMGVGIDFYPENVLIPIFADFRGVWSKQPQKVAFSYNFSLGYSFFSNIVNDESTWIRQKGGILLYPNIGIRIATTNRTNILLDIGYKFQHTERKFSDWWWGGRNYHDEIWYKSLVLRLGWEF